MKEDTHTQFWDKIEPADIIALVVICGVLVLNYKGITTMFSQSILLIIGYYFGRKVNSDRRNERGTN